MSTATLRLPSDLKARIAQAAKQAGVTPHLFMLEAVAEKTEQAERRAAFEAVADERYARVLESGETLDWQDVRAYLKARAAGNVVAKPAVRKKSME